MARVLIIEDEPAYCQYLRMFIEEEGHEVRTATSANEALGHLESGFEADILVVDWLLRDRYDGVDLCRKWKQRYPGLRTILITGNPRPMLDLKTQVEHPDLCLFKPFSRDEFMTAVRTSAY